MRVTTPEGKKENGKDLLPARPGQYTQQTNGPLGPFPLPGLPGCFQATLPPIAQFATCSFFDDRFDYRSVARAIISRCLGRSRRGILPRQLARVLLLEHQKRGTALTSAVGICSAAAASICPATFQASDPWDVGPWRKCRRPAGETGQAPEPTCER